MSSSTWQAINTRKGEQIVDTLTKVEEQLDTVTHMCWQIAIEKLKLHEQIIAKGGSKSIGNSFELLSHGYIIPQNKLQYQRLSKLHKHLIETHEQLELDCGVLFTRTFDPSCMEDPTHRITTSVSNQLLVKIKVVVKLLMESRQRLKL